MHGSRELKLKIHGSLELKQTFHESRTIQRVLLFLTHILLHTFDVSIISEFRWLFRYFKRNVPLASTVRRFCVPIGYEDQVFHEIGTKRSLWCKRGVFRSEFTTVNGTYCSQIHKLGLFSSEFLFAHGTHCSQFGYLGLLSSEFFICKWNALFLNWSSRTVLFRVPICKWINLFSN